MNKPKHFLTMGRLLGFYGAAIVALFLFSAGQDANQHHYFQMVVDLLLVLFGTGFLVIMVQEAWDNRLADMAHTAAPEIAKDLVAMLDKAFEGQKPSYENEMLQAIIKDTGGFPVKPERLEKLEAAYHENTDKYVRLTLGEGNATLQAEFGDKPFVAAEDTYKLPERPGVTRTHIPVVDGDAPAPKPPTKAQQRKANAKKGLGALTDEEVREQKNEKRRAARAAKKSAGSTTETTTLPGQTGLKV